MQEKVKEIQDYLKKRGIIVAETSIVNAAIDIATRWGDMWVFACEFSKKAKR